MTVYRTQRPKKRRRKGLLPLMGLVFAVLLGIVSYYTAPALIEFGEQQSDNLARQFDDFRANEDLPEQTLEWITALLLWLILMGLSVFIGSLFIGEDPEKESWKTMGPSPANKKAMIKQMKKDLKEAQKRAKQREAQQKKSKS